MISAYSRFARFFLLGAILSCAVQTRADTSSATSERTRWFREARFGLFIHWGVYAVPAGEWQGKPVAHIGEWIMKNGQIPVADYRAFAKDFTASKYDPEAWAALARRAGMKYVVITSKHHDGFALYDSAVSDWNAVKASAAGRDLLAPLAKAVRIEGLKFCLYYSQAQDWINPGGAKAGGKGDWDPAQAGDFDTYLATIALPQTREILERYSPAMLWWDTPTNMTPERGKPFAELLAQYPAVVTNNRLGPGYPGDTKTPEQKIPPRGFPGEMFEACMTMNNTWGFKKDDHTWKSVRQLLRNLSDISSKGGNFLLNVGPTAEGEIPAASIERLESIGRWMDVNGEAIHATEAGPFPRRLPWGRVTQKRSPAGATTLFLHVWEWPADGRVLLPTVAEVPHAARLLAATATVSTENSPEGLVVRLPAAAPDPDVSIVRLDFPGAVTVTQEPFPTPGTDGRVTFAPADAYAHGHWGSIQLRDAGPDAYLTDWTNPKWFLEYALKTPSAGKWTVTAEIAAPESTPLILAAGKTETSLSVAATGPDLTWQTITLGTIALPAGETTFELRGVPDGWKGVSVRQVWLSPCQ